MTWTIEQSRLGRVVVPETLGDDVAVFATTSDCDGRLTQSNVSAIGVYLAERFEFDGAIASCAQIHGSTIAIARASSGAWCETPGSDALVAADDRVALVIKIADCLPVALLDTTTGCVANVHSGWRGAAARIVPSALEKMQDLRGARSASIRAWLGPSIRECCFEVGEEVVDALGAAYGDVAPFVDRSLGARAHVDLAGLTTRVLTEAGVQSDAIDDSGICTRCAGSIFHSYRRDRDASGRNLMVIARRQREVVNRPAGC